jgi:hypothetical protein
VTVYVVPAPLTPLTAAPVIEPVVARLKSGTTARRPYLSKMGKAGIRAALYWPAITAMKLCGHSKHLPNGWPREANRKR